MNKNENGISVWAFIPLASIIAVIIYLNYDEWQAPEQTPRDLKGVDTLYTNDSTYVIKFSIDTVFETEYEEDGYDRR